MRRRPVLPTLPLRMNLACHCRCHQINDENSNFIDPIGVKSMKWSPQRLSEFVMVLQGEDLFLREHEVGFWVA